MAKGGSWDQLSPALRPAVGESIARSGMDLFFEHGWMNPDSHGGNFLIDAEAKKINIIDVAQAEKISMRPTSFLPDESYHFSQFLRAVEEKNAAQIVKYGGKIGKMPAGLSPQELEQMVNRMLSTFPDNLPTKERWIKLMNAMTESGYRFQPKFSLGALKGLMVFFGEKYVSPETLSALLQERVKVSLTGRKRILAAHEEIQKNSKENCQGYFQSLMRLWTKSR
jgi:predicted unusual protein kinase regulating ubiquinone biosynthesis (AarF/ABC1/UbiB family)